MMVADYPFYALDDKRTISHIHSLQKYGCEIGLHCDLHKNHNRQNQVDIDFLEEVIETSSRKLEKIISF